MFLIEIVILEECHFHFRMSWPAGNQNRIAQSNAVNYVHRLRLWSDVGCYI